MTSNNDDLHTVLRQNLRLRRQLGAQVAKAKDSSEGPYSPSISKLARWAAKRSTISIHDDVPPFETSGASSHAPIPPFRRLDSEGPRGSPAGAAKTDWEDNELKGLRRELALRRVAAEVPKESSEVRSGAAAVAASDTGDLGELRRQLKLRRELGAESTKAKESSGRWSDRIVFSSGWILYGICLAIAGVSALLMLRLMSEWGFHDEILIAATISALLFYGLGRDFLYAFSGR
jgi:hypothetical protein